MRNKHKSLIFARNRIRNFNYYLKKYKKNDKLFTRERKLKPSVLIGIILNNKGLSMKNELYNFEEDFKLDYTISPQALSKRRQQFSGEAIRDMNHDYVLDLYHDKETSKTTLNGYYILAIDGSDVVVPSSEDNYDYFNCARQNSKGVTQPCMCSISTIFDCLNKLTLDVLVNPYRTSERDSATDHIDNIRDIVDKKKYVVLFDRGYPGVKLIYKLVDEKAKFVMRLDSKTFKKEQKAMKSDDEEVEIVFDTTRTNPYRKDSELVERMQNESLTLRMVKVTPVTPTGEILTEYLLTNLTPEEFSTEEFGELYHLRWEIETVYRTQKTTMKLEEFSGIRKEIIEQDIYATILVYNICRAIINEMYEEPDPVSYKYTMKVNVNFSVGVLKRNLMYLLFFSKNSKEVERYLNKISASLHKYLVPFRQNRQYERKTVGNVCRMGYKYSY